MYKPSMLWSTVLLTSLLSALLSASSAQAWLMNKDVYQTFADPQDNFEVCFQGDFRNVPLNKGIIAPPGWKVSLSYNAQKKETCFSFFGPAIPQQPAGSPPIHFGLGVGQGFSLVQESREYWTRGAIGRDTPGGSIGFTFDPATSTATVTVRNDTPSRTVLQQIGWLRFPSEQPLATMDRGGMPPSSFNRSGIEPGTVLNPGDSVTFTIPGVAPTDSLVFLQTVGYAEPASDPDGYGSTVTIWSQETASVGRVTP